MDTLNRLPASGISPNTKQDTTRTADKTKLEGDLDISIKDR